MDKAEDSFSLNRLRAEKIAVGDNSKVFAAKYSSLTDKEKKAWVITAAIIREERMMREDAVWEEVAHVCENEESETFELNDIFLSD